MSAANEIPFTQRERAIVVAALDAADLAVLNEVMKAAYPRQMPVASDAELADLSGKLAEWEAGR
jgi:hypothetical protein